MLQILLILEVPGTVAEMYSQVQATGMEIAVITVHRNSILIVDMIHICTYQQHDWYLYNTLRYHVIACWMLICL